MVWGDSVAERLRTSILEGKSLGRTLLTDTLALPQLGVVDIVPVT